MGALFLRGSANLWYTCGLLVDYRGSRFGGIAAPRSSKMSVLLPLLLFLDRQFE
jgi:hypothetical protein